MKEPKDIIQKIHEIKNPEVAFTDDNYGLSLKYDGQRRKLYYKDGVIKMFNKKGDERAVPQDIIDAIEEKFTNTKADLVNQFLLDGELVYIDVAKGTQHRTQAQNPNAEVFFMIITVMELNGEDLTERTWIERDIELNDLCDWALWGHDEPEAVIKKIHHYFNADNKQKLYDDTIKYQLEGVVATHKDKSYRSKDKDSIFKIKHSATDDFIIIGYTDSANTKTGKRENFFGALVMAQYTSDGILRATGKIGGGFDNDELAEVTKLLHKSEYNFITTKEQSLGDEFGDAQPLNDKSYNETYSKINWLKPQDWFVLEAKFMNRTETGVPFLPRFVTIRDDKEPRECVYNEL